MAAIGEHVWLEPQQPNSCSKGKAEAKAATRAEATRAALGMAVVGKAREAKILEQVAVGSQKEVEKDSTTMMRSPCS